MATTHIDYRKIDYDQLLDKPIIRTDASVDTLTTAGVYDKGDGKRYIVSVNGQNITQVIEEKDGYQTRSSTDGGTTWDAWETVVFSKSGDIDAEDVNYDNTTSELVATNVQAAIDEIDTSVDDVKEDITDIQTDITNIEGDITNIQGDITEIKNIIEVTTMDTPSEDNEGSIVQYKGATNANFTHGYFYECVSDGQTPATYSWERIDVQPAGAGDEHEFITQTAYDALTPAQKAAKVYMIKEEGVPGSGLTAGAGIDITNNVISADMTTAVYDNTTSGATATNVQDAIDEVFQSVSNGKTLIAAAITDKGVQTAASDSFSTMATNIRAIDTSSSNVMMYGLKLYNNRVSNKDGRPVTRDHISWKEGGKYYGCCLYELEGSSANSFEVGVYTYRKINDSDDMEYTLNNVTGSVSGSVYTTMKERAFYTNGTNVKIVFIFDTTASSNSYRCYEAVWDYKNTGTTTNTLIGSGDSSHIADYNVDLTGYTNFIPAEWVDSVTGNEIKDNAYIYITLGGGYPLPPIVGDNYIELGTSSTNYFDIPIISSGFYVVDSDDYARMATTNVHVPAGNHTIKIIPANVTDGWNIGFKLVKGVTSIIHDAPFSAYNTSTTTVADDYKKEFAKSCGTLTSVSADVFTIPNTVTSIGNNFMKDMFAGCTSLTTVPAFGLPNTVTSIGDYFMSGMFANSGITTAPAENIGTGVQSIGTYFRQGQYTGCSGLTVAPAENIGTGVQSIEAYFRQRQYYGCTGLTTNATENIGNSVTSIGTRFREEQYISCTGITTIQDEQLPNTVTSIGGYFRNNQFSGCSNITTTGTESLPDNVTTIGTYFRNYQYNNCTSLTNIKGWKDLSVGASYYRANQFAGCTANKTVKVLTDVGYSAQSNTLSNTYVTEVQVPTAYLSNFTSTTNKYPRRSIDDSKFVGY